MTGIATQRPPTMATETNNFFSYQDIVDCKEKGGRELPLTKPYDPVKFWNDFGELFYKRFDKREKFRINVDWTVDRLKQLEAESLLEVGCGFGRMLPFFVDAGAVEIADGIDVSETLVNCSKEYLAPHEGSPDYANKVSVSMGDVRMLEFPSSSYDIVLSSETLQHLNQDDMELGLREIVRVAKRAIILIERWAFPSEHAEPHIWSYDYATILRSMGLIVAQVTTIAPSLQSLVALKRVMD